MFSKTALFVPASTQVRGMATLKEIRIRLKSVTNIQKITKSMKMVSAAKYAKAERDLKPARPYGQGATVFYDMIEAERDPEAPTQLTVAMTSDRGLCGGIHSSICKTIKHKMAEQGKGVDNKLVLVGDKARQMLFKPYKDNVCMTVNNIGKKPPSFKDASLLAQALLDLDKYDVKYDHGQIYFNIFKTVVSYKTTEMPLFTQSAVQKSKNIFAYDSVDDLVLRDYYEYQLSSCIFYALKECACSEQSSRMTAMDSATKNADEMIEKLQMTYNRTRQAVITRELIEIISGAAAL